MAKNIAPTKEEAKAKLEAFKEQIETSATSAKVRTSPTQDFLKEIEEVIRKAIEENVSYAQICRDIKEIYSFKISTQTLRAFAQNNLGVQPRQKKSRTATAVSEDKVFIEEEKTAPKKMQNSDGIKNEKKGF